MQTLVTQRVVGIALGYENLIDHDELRHDPALAVLAGKLSAGRADYAPLAGKSTLNRLERSRPDPTRYARIAADPAEVEAAVAAKHLYETIYCARGEMENRIKECQLDLFADRTSSATMRANQLRLWFSSLAYVLMCAAPDRPRGDGIGQCHLRHDPAEAAQDRRAGADQRAPGQRRHGLRLPVAGRVRTGPRRAEPSLRLSRHEPDTASHSTGRSQ